MESANLDPSSSDDRRLDALLRHAQPALSDAGFTNRVLAALPAKAPLRHVPSRTMLCAFAATAGVALVVTQGASLQTLPDVAQQLRDALANASTQFADQPDTLPGSGLLIAMTVTALSLLYAFSTNARAALRSLV